ncbi:PLP-dependent aspartate aminotransferase family protein [uncultured Pseudokineococcus sp.]|uniref:trans-sulfuration enzyme family protein n=1 Tax=uncultured Pseudokineococcus sp. TaxID=1642928 RepID=UPI00261F9CEB|nr:aminotransferase class I/II-fold pyridoxal phosphate-dependent enzyme [uncultured Pseudokineococcus sp.]
MADSRPERPWAPATTVVAAGRPPRTPDAPVNPPLVFSSTFVGAGTPGPQDRTYARSANASWEPLEEVLATLEGAREGGGALAFASGMAAVSAVAALVPVGGRVVAPRSSYNTSVELLEQLQAEGRAQVSFVDVADTQEVVDALGDGADLLWLESPTNPLLEVADLVACAEAGHRAGALVAVDGTFATPLVQQPLALGADVVVHSVTKLLSGHSDVLLGAVATSDPAVLQRLSTHRRVHGAIPGPFEAWLALRGVRTLALRVERTGATAADLARRLDASPAVDRVRHPSLPADPGHERARAQMRGFGSVLSIELVGDDDGARASALVDALRLWTPATSLGGVESLVERRRRHANEPTTTPRGLLRLSVGVEDVEDLWADLEQALAGLE